MISETKLDATFPTNLFFIQEYLNVYRLDRNNKSGGIMVFVKDDIITFLGIDIPSQWILRHFK